MEIITSLHIYNFHIIVSYLGSGIKIIPFSDFRYSNYQSKYNKTYINEINEKLSLNELSAKKHFLFGTSESKIYDYNLLNYKKGDHKKLFLPDILSSQLSIDPQYDDLYALSETSGIYDINISNPNYPQIRNTFIPKLFEKLGDPVVSNMITKSKTILLSIRGYGIASLRKTDDKIIEQFEYRSDDPQDVNYFSQHKIIVIADSINGIEFYDHNKNKTISFKLPNNDFPQQIEVFYNYLLIKGKFGLYLYNYVNKSFKNIYEGKVGILATYYDYIFFTSKGKLNLFIPYASKDDLGFKLKDYSQIELETNTYNKY
jgi:hypothetical protein